MKIKIAANQSDLELFYPLLLELRPYLTKEEFFDIYHHSKKQDHYELVGFYNDKNELCGLMGHRILYDFVRGRHFYIDDLVTNESSRSTGIGAKMLLYGEKRAKELNCSGGLRLCAGLENTRGADFYEKNGWKKRAYAFVKKIP